MEQPYSEWLPAVEADLESLLPMLEEFYTEERLDHQPEEIRRAVAELVANPDLGTVWLLHVGGVCAGYLIAITAFGVEFGGRYVFVDELYIRPEYRGGGKWRAGFREVEAWARGRGIHAMRLEVNHHNDRAMRIYLADGFKDDERSVLTKRITPAEVSGG